MNCHAPRFGLLFPIAFLTLLAMDVTAAGGAESTVLSGDAARGQSLYESRCIACHSLDSNRVGPKHRGAFGRRAGSVADYNYSRALAKSNLIWTNETLDLWLINPQDLIPGQRMNVRVKDAQDRGDIIAYLRQES